MMAERAAIIALEVAIQLRRRTYRKGAVTNLC
jgi:hypothetical protein